MTVVSLIPCQTCVSCPQSRLASMTHLDDACSTLIRAEKKTYRPIYRSVSNFLFRRPRSFQRMVCVLIRQLPVASLFIFWAISHQILVSARQTIVFRKQSVLKQLLRQPSPAKLTLILRACDIERAERVIVALV